MGDVTGGMSSDCNSLWVHARKLSNDESCNKDHMFFRTYHEFLEIFGENYRISKFFLVDKLEEADDFKRQV